MISIDYQYPPKKNTSILRKSSLKKLQKHVIHKALHWQKLLDEGKVNSLSEIARKEGLTRARVTQIMNLLKLPDGVKNFLAGLKDPNKI